MDLVIFTLERTENRAWHSFVNFVSEFGSAMGVGFVILVFMADSRQQIVYNK